MRRVGICPTGTVAENDDAGNAQGDSRTRPREIPPRQTGLDIRAGGEQQIAPQVTSPSCRLAVTTNHDYAEVIAFQAKSLVLTVRKALKSGLRARPNVYACAVRLEAPVVFNQVQLPLQWSVELKHLIVGARLARVCLKRAVHVQVGSKSRNVDAIELRLVERFFKHDKTLWRR